MAVFLLKAKFGSVTFRPLHRRVFDDVPCARGTFIPSSRSSPAGHHGRLPGAPLLYCPDNTVTRGQMAVFLLKALEGSDYDPPDCAGIFGDVACTPGTGFSDFIEELYNRTITGGCQLAPLLYCPNNPNNRGQMAVFLVKTFELLLYGFPPPPL